MANRDLTELLQSAAPTPRGALDIGQIEYWAHRRRRRRHLSAALASLLVTGLLIGLAVQIPKSRGRDTVIAGPASSRMIPIEFRAGTAIAQIRLLDGTRLRLTVPEAVGRGLAGMTFADLELHGSLYAEPGGRPPRGWSIDVAVGSVETLIPGGEPLVVPPSSRASAAAVDRSGHRLGLQFGSWALVASGDSLTDGDIDALLAGVALAETPDGFVEYRGSLPLWPVDSADAGLGGRQVAVGVSVPDYCSTTVMMRPTPNGLESYRIENAYVSGGVSELCDRVNRLRITLRTTRPLTDKELDQVRIDVLSVGPTLAGVQRGEWP